MNINGLTGFAGQKNLSGNIGAKTGGELPEEFRRQLEKKGIKADMDNVYRVGGYGESALKQIYESMRGAVATTKISESWNGTPTPVRGLDADACDAIYVHVLDGYVIKGKEEDAGVYLEIKYDDGRVEAYMANALPQTQNRQAAPHIVKHAKYTEYQKEPEAPYGFLTASKKEGEIIYNGVMLWTNAREQTISVGDMSNEKKVLSIPLPSGGVLKVSRDSIGSLGRAMGMFSPEDQGAIMRALAADAKRQKDGTELEEEQSGIDLYREKEKNSTGE